uniref:Zinc finger PHD-type domain-containing protein n=1 Tax=Fagus sylvatica TaxID=28930 RepID=A0A2N9EZ45_FAGSY
MEIKHFDHDHLLSLSNIKRDDQIQCNACFKDCVGETYICSRKSCDYSLHESCAKLPRKVQSPLAKSQIQHFFHPHPLTLQSGHTTCKACYKHFAWYYSCEQCYFDMDIDCTLLPNTINIKSDTSHEFEQIHHFLHGHPLMSLKDDQKEVDCYCYVCGKSCTAPTPTYVCGKSSCDHIYFHKSCLELPQQIYHPFHPYHPLTLLEQSDERKCNACRKSSARTFKPDLRHVAYTCQSHNCRFLLHAECSVMNMMPAIKYEGHGHLLQFRDDNDKEKNKLKCRSCKYNICESYAFTCLYCNLNLHLACGPLPYIIKHKGYIDPLVLTNSPVEEEVEDETDEFYCHVCEEERDPRLPVYYSAECYFVAEIKCVISEVRLLLKGEYGEVELRSTLGHSGKLIFQNEAKEMVQKKEQVKKTLTLYAILKSWSKDEIEQLNSVLKSGERTLHIAQEDDNDKDSVCQTFLVSDEAYTRFMKVLDRGAKIPGTI